MCTAGSKRSGLHTENQDGGLTNLYTDLVDYFERIVCINMVNLTTIAQARKPHLIYGVKRGKVPKKLRPHLLPQSEKLGGKLTLSRINMCPK